LAHISPDARETAIPILNSLLTYHNVSDANAKTIRRDAAEALKKFQEEK
jgi:hypothetical protein